MPIIGDGRENEAQRRDETDSEEPPGNDDLQREHEGELYIEMLRDGRTIEALRRPPSDPEHSSGARLASQAANGAPE